jgi:hypothetical protein
MRQNNTLPEFARGSSRPRSKAGLIAPLIFARWNQTGSFANVMLFPNRL